MVMETIEKVMANLGAADIDSRLEEQLIDGILYAFQEQTTEVSIASNIIFFRSLIVTRKAAYSQFSFECLSSTTIQLFTY
jgi:hypothetical protein